jgi:uncharacterized membrane protein YhaH (DUF805 family)
MIIYGIWYGIFSVWMESDYSGTSSVIFLITFIPMIWLNLAQGAKRCHDRDNSGWYQLIPFYGLWMLFAKGDYEENDYGVSLK